MGRCILVTLAADAFCHNMPKEPKVKGFVSLLVKQEARGNPWNSLMFFSLRAQGGRENLENYLSKFVCPQRNNLSCSASAQNGVKLFVPPKAITT